MKQSLVSVIIPIYDTGKEAQKLVQKILQDNYKNLEIICVDDGSKDDSLKILQTIKDPRVKIFHKQNGGAASARNYGIKKAHGEYLLFIDSDDDIAQTFISRLVNAIEKPGIDLVSTAIKYRRLNQGTSANVYTEKLPGQKNNESKNEYILRLLLTDGRLYSLCSKIYKTKIIQENKLEFEEGVNFAEDTHFVLNYIKNMDGRVEFILQALYIYNFGTNSSTVAKSSLPWKNWEKSYMWLIRWVGGNAKVNLRDQNISKREKVLLKKILWRWKISHMLAVGRAKLSVKEKCKYLNPLLLPVAWILVKIRP